MTIVYYSTPWFLDCDLPLLKAFKDKGNIVYFILSVSPHSNNATLLNNCELKDEYGIFSAKEYRCLQIFKDYFPLENWYVINYPNGTLKNLTSIYQYYKLERKLEQFIAHTNCDIFHVSGIQREFDYLLARRFKDRLITTMHDPIPHDVKKVTKYQYWTAYSFLKLPQKAILLNNQQTTEFCNRYNFDTRKIAYSHLGTYECMELFSSNETAECDKYILFFGRIQSYKGVDLLVRAMRIVHEKQPELKLIIAGKGHIEERIDDEYITLINKYITTEQLAVLLKNCLFTVCPYISSTQSGVLSTAFAMDVPVLATKVGGMSECIKNNITGVLIEPNNETVLADAICKLSKDAQLLQDIKENIKIETSEGYFSWGKIADCYLEAYKSIK